MFLSPFSPLFAAAATLCSGTAPPSLLYPAFSPPRQASSGPAIESFSSRRLAHSDPWKVGSGAACPTVPIPARKPRISRSGALAISWWHHVASPRWPSHLLKRGNSGPDLSRPEKRSSRGLCGAPRRRDSLLVACGWPRSLLLTSHGL